MIVDVQGRKQEHTEEKPGLEEKHQVDYICTVNVNEMFHAATYYKIVRLVTDSWDHLLVARRHTVCVY